MAYQLKAEESVEESIKRIVREQVEKAIVQLADQTAETRGEAVHDARKRFKKIRAVLRLAQDGLGKKVYKQENSCYRDAGRYLSDVRDAQVRLETLDGLVKHFSDTIASDAFSALRQVLKKPSSMDDQSTLSDEDAIAKVLPILESAYERVGDWSITQSHGSSALESGFERGYRLGHRAMKEAIANPTSEHFHEWRKQVKDLWYHSCILKPLWPGIMDEWANQTHQLADYLGDDHDLAVLREFLLSQSDQLQDHVEELSVLISLIDRRQAQLQLEAEYLGQRVYAESPKAFGKRMSHYWKTWQSEQQASPPIALTCP